ncbi:M4 family metallopeptidase [Elioraea rosea]|uniref:M4 family metallopeptidase n=1 Tax=Elioraea rosea TaxID=2492390 RepID=UPI0011820416|nr:M4 family metallopeptidase [Elioraea rosea]
MSRAACRCGVCCITPPLMLENIIARARRPSLKRWAEDTLAVTRTLREARLSESAPDPEPEMAARKRSLGKQRAVYSARQGQSLPGSLIRPEGAPPTGDPAVDEAFEGAGITYDFFRTVFGHNGLDGNDLRMVSTVHYGRGYDNAFWNGKQMVYGDGDGEVFLRFTKSLDVVAHELAHAVLEFTANLVYWEQPGALNEHFSDVMGSLTRQWHHKEKAAEADWLIGAELIGPELKQPPGVALALRSLKAPGTAYDDPLIGRDPQPAHMRDLYRGHSDSGGVHINSGIPNRVFWRVATGFGGYAWEKAGRIWWRAFTEKGRMSQRASFREAAKETIDVAGILFDAKAAKLVAAAWDEAGVVPTATRRKAEAPAPKPKKPAPKKLPAPKKKAPAPTKSPPKKAPPKKPPSKKPPPKKAPPRKAASARAGTGARAIAARSARVSRHG